MGLVRTKVTLANPKRCDLSPIEVEDLVDTGAVHLCVPDHVAIQLSLDETEKREMTALDGSRRAVPYVGPVVTRFGNRSCFSGAMVLGGEVLLGAIPMADMDLVVRPSTRDVGPNPKSPELPTSIAVSPR